ncbi:Hpt domain-containing protein [Candidatus Auribacterota bacterium]
MNKKNTKKISTLVEELALNSVVEEINSPKEIDTFKSRFQKLKSIAEKNKDKTVEEVLSLLIPPLTQVDIGLETAKKIISSGISFLQTAVNNNGYEKNFDIKVVKNHLSELLGPPQDTSVSSAEILYPEELAEFISGTKTNIEELESNLLEIEKDLENKERLDAIFRAFHTIKGEASLVGVNNMAALTHDIENILEKVRDGEISLQVELISLMLNIIDVLKEINSRLESDVKKGLAYDISDYKEKVSKIFTALEAKTSEDFSEPTSTNKAKVEKIEEAPKPETKEEKVEDYTPQIPKLDLEEKGEIVSEFLSEAAEHLEAAENSLLALEKSPENKKEDVNNIFRAFHTIKGVSGFLDLKDIGALTHDTETMIDFLRKGKLGDAVTEAVFLSEAIEASFLAVDALRRLFNLLREQIENNGALSSPYYDIAPALKMIRTKIKAMQKSSRKKY